MPHENCKTKDSNKQPKATFILHRHVAELQLLMTQEKGLLSCSLIKVQPCRHLLCLTRACIYIRMVDATLKPPHPLMQTPAIRYHHHENLLDSIMYTCAPQLSPFEGY